MISKQEEWDSFVSEVALWRRAYIIFSAIAKSGNLTGLLALKHHLHTAAKKYSSNEEQRKREYFEEILIELEDFYTPDEDLVKLKDTLVCLDIHPDSYLYLEYGKCICGFYIDMDKEPSFTSFRNDETGEYEKRECNIVLNLGYPTPQNIIKITFLDTKGITTFN